MNPIGPRSSQLRDAWRAVLVGLKPRELRKFVRDLQAIRNLLADEGFTATHFPEEARKSRRRILLEHILWRLRHRAINQYYFCWGLDRVAAPRLWNLLGYGQFRSMRDRCNRKPFPGARFNYIVLLRDKVLFWQFMRARGYPSPAVLGVSLGASIQWADDKPATPVERLAVEADGLDVVVKPIMGEQGAGVFRLAASRGMVSADGVPIEVSRLARLLTAGMLLQERVEQHAHLAAIHPSSLNTVRITTVRDAGVIRQFSYPYFRVGSGGSTVDNFKAGGIQVIVDPASGRLKGPGRRLYGGITHRHPDSGVIFDGFEIPYFPDAVRLALTAHGAIPGLHSVGWDVAVTPYGPTLIEGNDNWNGSIRMGLDPDFGSEFTRLCTQADTEHNATLFPQAVFGGNAAG
jgi:hypothetical protein